MSNKQHDLYLEELSRLEEDYNDAQKASADAEEEYISARDWRRNRYEWFMECAKRLKTFKEKDL